MQVRGTRGAVTGEKNEGEIILSRSTRVINVAGSMKRVMRALVHVYTGKKQNEIQHQYLGGIIQFGAELKE